MRLIFLRSLTLLPGGIATLLDPDSPFRLSKFLTSLLSMSVNKAPSISLCGQKMTWEWQESLSLLPQRQIAEGTNRLVGYCHCIAERMCSMTYDCQWISVINSEYGNWKDSASLFRNPRQHIFEFVATLLHYSQRSCRLPSSLRFGFAQTNNHSILRRSMMKW